MSNDFEMSISIPTDNDGYILLQCEHCGTFFKLTPGDVEDDGVLDIFCPSCGLTSECYLTEEVLDLAMNMAENKVNEMLEDMFKGLERGTRNGLVKFKTGKRLPKKSEEPIRSSIEALDVCEFVCCHRTAKVKPLLKITGAYCPFCGVKDYEIE